MVTYRNQTIGLKCESVYWFQCDSNIVHRWFYGTGLFLCPQKNKKTSFSDFLGWGRGGGGLEKDQWHDIGEMV